MCFSDCLSMNWELQYSAEILKDLTNQEESLSHSLHKCLAQCL